MAYQWYCTVQSETRTLCKTSVLFSRDIAHGDGEQGQTSLPLSDAQLCAGSFPLRGAFLVSHFIHIEENPAALRQPLHHSFSSSFLPRCANLPIFQMCYFQQLKGFFRSGSLIGAKAVQFALSR